MTQEVKKPVHRILAVYPSGEAGNCSVCGEVKIKPQKGRQGRCHNAYLATKGPAHSREQKAARYATRRRAKIDALKATVFLLEQSISLSEDSLVKSAAQDLAVEFRERIRRLETDDYRARRAASRDVPTFDKAVNPLVG